MDPPLKEALLLSSPYEKIKKGIRICALWKENPGRSKRSLDCWKNEFVVFLPIFVDPTGKV